MEKQEVKNKSEKQEVKKTVQSNLDPKSEVKIIFEGNEHIVSGDVANILINKGKAKLKD